MLLGQNYGVPQLNVADLTQAPPQMGSFAPQAAPAAPFQWGQGGVRLSPEQLALRQRVALQQQQTDYSPIASPWQGLARVAENVTGALEQKSLDKQATAQQMEGQQSIAALLGGDASAQSSAVASALAGADPVAQKLAFDVYDRAHPKPHVNDTVADYDFWKGALPPEQFDQYVANKINPPHFAMLPNGQMGMVGGYQPPATQGPAVGAVQDGYRFKGGDASDQKNWEPVR